MTDMLDLISELFERLGRRPYESGVNHLEHALQSAFLAEQAEEPLFLIIAALLHDIGHLVLLDEENTSNAFIKSHEKASARFLESHFQAAVTEPARLHVDAKRYLCAVDPLYRATLSMDSRASLVVQGGSFEREECEKFLAERFAQEAIRLRRIDDQAKVPGYRTPELSYYILKARELIIIT